MQESRHRKNVSAVIRIKPKTSQIWVCIKKHLLVCLRYAMKCLDKKRIKMKQGETLALNERIMLSLVSTGVSDTYKLRPHTTIPVSLV